MRCMRTVLVPEETSLTRLLQARRVYYGERSSLCKTLPPVVRVSRVIAYPAIPISSVNSNDHRLLSLVERGIKRYVKVEKQLNYGKKNTRD